MCALIGILMLKSADRKLAFTDIKRRPSFIEHKIIWLISHSKVGDLLRELSIDQALEVLPVLADQVPVGALGEGANPQARDAALRALQIEYLRLVSTRRPEGRKKPLVIQKQIKADLTFPCCMASEVAWQCI